MSDMNEKRAELKSRTLGFIAACDELDETAAWDKDVLGDMDAYFFNDILCTIIRLIAVDGDFTSQELAFVNDVLDTQYDMDTLKQIHWQCGDRIKVMLDTELPQSIALLQGAEPSLAESFKSVITLLCQTLIASDGIVTPDEAALAEGLIAQLA